MVLAQHRGQGIGSTVLHKLLAAASAAGKPLRLAVASNNGRALQLYERLGFQRIGGDEAQHYMEHPPGGRGASLPVASVPLRSPDGAGGAAHHPARRMDAAL